MPVVTRQELIREIDKLARKHGYVVVTHPRQGASPLIELYASPSVWPMPRPKPAPYVGDAWHEWKRT